MDSMIMHNQWRDRPADERFATLADMFAALNARTRRSGETTLPTDGFKIAALNHGSDTLALVGPKGNPAVLSHWSMNQVCTIAHAPATYLRTIPADLAAQCLNVSIAKQPRDAHKLYVEMPDDSPHAGRAADAPVTALQLRAITSPGYARITSNKLVARLQELTAQQPHWHAPEVYEAGDYGGRKSPCVGFAGDRDMYVCLIDDQHTIPSPSNPGGELMRGIIVANSEVGAKRLDVIMFLCDRICGNYIIWGMQQIKTISMRHFGQKIQRDWSYGVGNVFADYANSSAREETDKIQASATKQIAGTKEDVIDLIFKRYDIGKQDATDAYALAEQHNQNPRTPWGIVHGLTRLSQLSKFADDRIDMDRKAAKILDF